MFTGLVESLGRVVAVEPVSPGRRLVVSDAITASDADPGDSVAVNGCCLTVVAANGDRMTFEAGPETLARTTLGALTSGSRVNLERSLALGGRLGGHLVTGHVDAVGSLERRQDEGEWSTFWFRAPADLALQMASKGSIAVDGVSLTLVEVQCERFSVALIPHTLAATTLGGLHEGSLVNLETDLLAKYVQRQLRGQDLESGSDSRWDRFR